MRPRSASATCAAAVAVLVVAGCTSSTESEPPDYRPSPPQTNVEGAPGARISPIVPVPSLPGDDGSAGGGGSSGGSSSSAPERDPLVVATKLSSPVGLTMLPDNTALVGERTTGRIVRVQPQAGKPVPTVRTLPGVDGAGDGGLLDLALSPTYDEDSLVYAYLSTRTDNRVVAFTLDGPVTPVITGIPHARTGNVGRLSFTSTGTLEIGTGSTGRPSLSVSRASLAGKVLRITDIGSAAAGNPNPGSPVYASGLRGTDGFCPVPDTAITLQLEGGGSGTTPGEINVITRAGNYTTTAPIGRTPANAGATGDCAVLDNRLYVTALDGKELLAAPLTRVGASSVKIGAFTPELKDRYGRLRTVVAAADGALWLTTSNRDGKGAPVADDERVIRYVPSGGQSANPA